MDDFNLIEAAAQYVIDGIMFIDQPVQIIFANLAAHIRISHNLS